MGRQDVRERVPRPGREAVSVNVTRERAGGAPCGLDVPLGLAFALGLVLEASGECHPAQVQDAGREVAVGCAERGGLHGGDGPVDDDRAAFDVSEVEVGARAVAGTERLGDGVGLLPDGPPLPRDRELAAATSGVGARSPTSILPRSEVSLGPAAGLRSIATCSPGAGSMMVPW
ncbi:hypothetical protein [Streptomyces sp. NPDC056061]|uniref:hypothetical protein n=1 Tax=Streptomyces sp. NPDC056061 TaxID=3345700 RepID=UPI0035D94D63